MSRDAARKLVESICYYLNLNCSNLYIDTFYRYHECYWQEYDEELNFILCVVLIIFDNAYPEIFGPNCFVNSSALNVYLDHIWNTCQQKIRT